uniref:Uncharacterized protein n=1 Tax=Panagrolaimus davidi TaxID=227884 RepID=A0A914P0B2_9BILA
MVLSCEKEPLFALGPGINQKCEIGGDSDTIEIDCQRCCETWGLSKGVGKDKQSGSYDYDNNACWCCKLQCAPGFSF